MRILLAVDGSDQSFEATKALQYLAPAEEVTVFHVLEGPPKAEPFMMSGAALDLYRTMERQFREDGEKVLDQATSFLPPHIGRVSRRLEAGDPAKMILETAEKSSIGLIVLGARGLGPIRELIFGSVSHAVVSHAPCPVLVVKKPMRSLTRILIAVEGDRDAESVVRFLTAMPFRAIAELTVLHAPQLLQPVFDRLCFDFSDKEKAREGAQHFVEKIASRLSSHYRAKGVVHMGLPPAVILQEAEASKPDLVVIGSYAPDGVAGFLLGSVSHAVLHRAPCPVLILR
jgi:nucleotide-binding universal stress UspA family protein